MRTVWDFVLGVGLGLVALVCAIGIGAAFVGGAGPPTVLCPLGLWFCWKKWKGVRARRSARVADLHKSRETVERLHSVG